MLSTAGIAASLSTYEGSLHSYSSFLDLKFFEIFLAVAISPENFKLKRIKRKWGIFIRAFIVCFFKRALMMIWWFGSEIFLLGFKQKMTDLKTSFTKFELTTTFRSQDILAIYTSPFFPLQNLPGLPTTNKILKRYGIFVTLNKCFRHCCCQNKAKGQNCKIVAFEINLSQFSKS